MHTVPATHLKRYGFKIRLNSLEIEHGTHNTQIIPLVLK